MLDLATSSLRYRDVTADSPAGHRETDQVASPSRDEFTVSFLSRLWFNCSIHVGVWCVFFCCVPVILCMILRAIFKFKKPDSFFCLFWEAHARVHEQEFWLCRSGFPWVGFAVRIGIILYCLQVHWCLAREKCVLAYFLYSALLQFSLFCVISAVVLPLTSHPTLYSPMPTCFAQSPISFISHHRFPYSWKTLTLSAHLSGLLHLF